MSESSQSLTPLQRAFLALEQTRAQLRAAQDAAREPIAIIGIGCRIPGDANDPESFWRLLHEGRDAVSPLPADRWDVDALYHPDPEHSGTIATRAGGFLRSIDTFDPTFFGITRREAAGMDPQQRVFLETCWEALEHAAQPPDRLERSATGVYVGVCGSDYAYLQLAAQDRTLLDAHFASGIAHSVASGRLSYLLGLQGPSLTIDTACSSSLVAVHLACQALRAGDCRMALAGGVNLILAPELYIALSQARMLSPDGRCKTFDAAADGFARGEGSAVIVLKRLRDAEADGDRILAVVRGTAVNQDGPSSGLTAPNGPAQEAVIREALARAGIAPKLVSYIEAHGTGTQLGDPLELRALGAVFRDDREEPLYVGSLKTNVGHLEAAAGVAGLIKLVLSLQHREIPAHLHLETPTPHIAWDELRLRMPTTRVPWTPIEGRRIAGVSSFGFSGTNAHIVVEEAPPVTPAARVSKTPTRRHVFVLSGVDEASLRAVARRHAESFAKDAAVGRERDLADVCFTAAVGRAHHAHRAAIMAGSITELREKLESLANGADVEGVRVGRLANRDPARIAYLFTGQGAQYAGMGRELFEGEPVFRTAIERCAAALEGRLDRSLIDILYPSAGADAPSLDETAYTQPALFAVEYALASLWQSWNVRPDALIGHSVGEYAAACVAGVFSVEDAARLIAERGRLMQSLPAGGAMAAIFAPEQDVVAALDGHASSVSVAAVNAPGQTVVSGVAAGVDALCATFTARGVRCQRLTVSHAFHSVLVEPVLDAFTRAAEAVRLDPPALPLVSNVTGRIADAAVVTTPKYWRDHIRAAVRFGDGARALAQLRPDVCLEVGPHPTLLPLAQEAFGDTPATFVASLRKTTPAREQLDDALGALYLAGAPIDWRAVWSAAPASLVELAPYPFQRERCWFSPRRVAPSRGRETGHPLLGVRLHSALSDIVQFEQTLRASDLPFFRDHVVQGRAILPGAGFLEMALAASRRVFDRPQSLDDVIIAEPLVADGEASRRVQTVIRMPQGEPATFEILSVDAEDDEAPWQTHVKGVLTATSDTGKGAPATPIEGGATISATEHRATLAARGLVFGPSLHGVQQIDARSGESRAMIELRDSALDDFDRYALSPALLDASLQALSAAIPAGAARDGAYLPLAIESVRLYRTPGFKVTAHARVDTPERRPSDTLTGRVTIVDEAGVAAELTGITLRVASSASTTSATAEDLYTIEWQLLDDARPWTPSLTELANEAGPSLETFAREHGLAEYEQGFTVLESLVTRWIVGAFRELGWSDRVGTVVRAEAFANSAGVVPRYHRLVGRFFAILGDAGVLTPGAGGWVVARTIDVGDPDRDAARLLEKHPSSRARIELARRCGSVLAGILRGTVDPLQQLFPGGSTELAISLYRDTPEAKAYNQLVRDAVAAIARRLPPDRKLRVLEVGGGTGGTTAWVAPALDASRTEYTFTDVGPSLVAAARDRFQAAHPFMSFTTLDLERALEEQDVAGPFDVILASNVIHATADLRQTLGRLQGVLAPGGTLLMLEVAGREWWIDLTFGLTEGWWRFTDTDVRSDYPLLDRAQWRALLSSLGFEAGEIGREQAESREALLAARKPAAAQPARVGRWLVLADAGGVGEAIADRLRASGRDTFVIPSRAREDADALARMIEGANAGDLAGVIHLGALDLAPLDDADTSSAADQQQGALGSLLGAVQALGRGSFAADSAPRLWVATRGAQPVGVASRLAVEQSPIIGLALGIAREHPELAPTRVDLDASASTAAQADALFALLGRGADDDAYALRGDGVFVPRLTPQRAATEPSTSTVERLVRVGSHGTLDELTVVSAPRVAPAAGQVEIEVHAAGLNFRDVMNAVAMRADPEPLGGECAGRIVAVGNGVTEFAVGDDVVAIAEGCFATYAVTDIAHVMPLPSGVSFAAAATLPFAFMTAKFALEDCAHLAAGESVLIHAGAGGVGQAAIQLARATGAMIIATAGSDAKRQFLRDQGVEHVLDSRSLAFGEQVRALTNGKGVDVVLNSLAGEFIAESVACLAENGRFCEIGKRDIWTAEAFAGVRPRGRYFAIDLNALRIREPATSAALFERVMADVTAGVCGPLPLRAFPLHRASDAFRFMAQARHIGKVVLVPERAMRTALDALSPQATYLVTGGLTGIGLLTARRLAERGARHLVLAGRRAPNALAEAAIADLREMGAEVHVASLDVSDGAALQRLFDEIDASMPPLRGVVHSAGALDDAALVQQTWERFVTPLRAKVDGAWTLHALTANRPLDFFVLYSSIASVLGSSGQANHSAANAFLDALAEYRRVRGLVGVSISWGAWSEIGAAVDRGVEQRVGAFGIGTIAPARGLELIDAAMHGGDAHVAAFPVSWERFLAKRASPHGRGFFDRVAQRRQMSAARSAAPVATTSAAAGVIDVAALRDASSAQRHSLLLAFVGEQVARVVGAPSARSIAVDQPLNEIGLDSLMAVELRNRLGRGLQLTRSLPATMVFDHPTLDALARYLDAIVAPPAAAPVATPVAAPVNAADALDEMSEEEIEAMFANRTGKH